MVKLGKQGRIWIMGVELDKKHATIAMRACYRSASRHPVVVAMILFTIWFYRSFPLLFSLLLYASPVLISTATLLGTLLLFGHQKSSRVRKERKPHHHEIHNLIRVVEDTEFDGKCVRSEAPENAFGKNNSVVNNVDLNDDHRRPEISSRRSSIDSRVSVSMADKLLKEDAKSEVSNHSQKTDLGGDKVLFVSHCAQFQSPPQAISTDDHKLRSEISSPTASSSMAGTFTLVDDLSPLLQPQVIPHHAHTSGPDQVHHHAHMSNANPYAASNHSLESDESDDDDEANGSTWTEDDQKNLKTFGKSETERNQHLENLVARKKAIRNMRIQAEENLVNINLDISYSATPHASTRRNSFDQPYDLNETILESVPSVIMPIINPFELPYDPSVDKSYQAGPTFQSDSLSFQPNNQFSHSHEGFDVGPTTFTFGSSENVSQRSRSSDDDDMAKLHQVARDGRVYEVQKSQPHDHFSHVHESSDVGPSSLEGYQFHASKVSEYVSHNDDMAKLHQVADGYGRHDEVKTSDGGEKGYQGKSSCESSSSSSFSDVTDHLDDEEEQCDFSSAIMPSTPERQMQEQWKKDHQQSPKPENDEGRLSQRPSKGVTSWFVWKS